MSHHPLFIDVNKEKIPYGDKKVHLCEKIEWEEEYQSHRKGRMTVTHPFVPAMEMAPKAVSMNIQPLPDKERI